MFTYRSRVLDKAGGYYFLCLYVICSDIGLHLHFKFILTLFGFNINYIGNLQVTRTPEGTVENPGASLWIKRIIATFFPQILMLNHLTVEIYLPPPAAKFAAAPWLVHPMAGMLNSQTVDNTVFKRHIFYRT